MFHKPLFGKGISPSCAYCAYSELHDDETLHCEKKGEVQQFDHCSQFSYDPLRRKPHRLPQMPSFSPEDFEL